MKIGYITKQNPNDILGYSGTHYHMYKALQKNFDEVIPFGPIEGSFPILPKIYGRLLRFRSKKIYKYQYNIGLAKRAARLIDEKIQETKPDVLLASLMSPEVAYLKSNLPLYITTDATFPLLKDMYQSHSNLHPKSIEEAMHLEGQAFERATKLLLPLEWLADSAMKDYGVPVSKIEVIPYGSNLGLSLGENDIEALIEQRVNDQKLKLLFVGVRWEEKGGPFAVDVIDELQKMGIDSELIIAGCDPDIDSEKAYINKVGFFDKSDLKQKEAFVDLYKQAHFFIMPTKAECVGMSFIEAGSVGLPAIGTEVGGVPEAIIDEKTGHIIKGKQSAKDVANWVFTYWNDNDAYRSMIVNAFQIQTKTSNWETWSDNVKKATG